MAQMTPQEPQSAAEYDDRTTAAVKSVLIEIGQILSLSDHTVNAYSSEHVCYNFCSDWNTC